MSKIATFKRYEMKFILNQQQFNLLLPNVRQHMNADSYCENGKDYCISNLYYDTKDNYLIRTSVAKPFYKEKLRIRGYGCPLTPDETVFVELKKKAAGIVYKRRATMSLREAYDFVEHGIRPRSTQYIDAQVIRELEYFLGHYRVKPTALISYRRMAFFGEEDPAFRVTFDYDLMSRRNDLRLEHVGKSKALLAPEEYLLEVKLSGSVPLWLADSLAELGIYKQSFSKYGTDYENMVRQERLLEPNANACQKNVAAIAR